MTHMREAGVILSVLATVALAFPAQAGDYLSAEGGYQIVLDEPTPANQVALQPIALTAGQEYFDVAGVEEALLRCSVFAGRKGVGVSLEGDIAEGDELEPTGSFRPKSQKTKRNGYARIELAFDDLDPPTDPDFEDPLLIAMEATLGGNGSISEAEFRCTLGVPSTCVADDTTACLQDQRFKVEMSWIDPFDGSDNQAMVLSSDDSGTTFFFPPLPTATNRLVSVLDNCGRGLPFRGFAVEAAAQPDVVTSLVITDTVTGVARRFGPQFVQDGRAFDTCP